MKKYSVAALVLVLVGIAGMKADATVSIDWKSDATMSAGVFLDSGFLNPLPAGSIVQLIFSPVDTGLAAVDPNNPLTPSGQDEVLLGTYYSMLAGGGLAYWNAGVDYYGTPGQYVGGYAYQRVFATDGVTIPGTQYDDSGASEVLPNADAIPQPSPTLSALFDSSQTGPFYLSNVVPIPEPSTIALAFAGLGFFLVRTIRSRKKERA